jgi:hypothetical protein
MTVEEQSIGQEVICPTCRRTVTVSPPRAAAAIGVAPAAPTGQLSYAAPAMSAGGPIAPPPADEVQVPAELPPKLRFPGCPTCHLVISSAGADVNANFDASPVLRSFAEAFAKALKKKFDVQLSPPAAGQPAMLSFVRVIRLDQGNRWLRYFFGLFAGGTTLELDGHVTPPGGQPIPFTLKHRGRLGVLGGDSLALLKLDGKILGKKVAKRVKQAAN